MIVIIFDLTVEALETFGRLDFAGARDRLDRTGILAEMAGAPAFRAPLQQIDEMQSVGKRQNAAERTKKAAIGTLGEEANHKQRARVKDIRPRAGEMRRDGGVERFHFRDARPHLDRERGKAEDERRRNILSKPQISLHGFRRIPLWQTDEARKLRKQFLQGAEGAEPAAKYTAAQQHERDRRVYAYHYYQRLGEIEAEPKMTEWRLHVIDDMQDGELAAGDPAFPDQHKKQERIADDPMGTSRLRKFRLKSEDQSQKREQRRPR